MDTPPKTPRLLEVRVCNPLIPLGCYQDQMVLAVNHLGRHLTIKKFKALVRNKLRLDDPEPKEYQYLQSAVETTVCAHYAFNFPSDFVYEDKVVPPRDVDCSFRSQGYKFNIEVKCADYTRKQEIDSKGGFKIRGLGRLSDFRDLTAQLQASFAKQGQALTEGLHMDNKMKEFLYDAHGKFPDAKDQSQYNVLVVGCDDASDMQQWEGYLTARQGLFTDESFADPTRYANVDLVVLTNLYHRHKSVQEKDKLTDHWVLASAFNLLYSNPKSNKPVAMLQAFARTLPVYNNQVLEHKIEGDVPDDVKERLAIPAYVNEVLLPSGYYTFQPESDKSLYDSDDLD